jgi:hypothetical protein
MFHGETLDAIANGIAWVVRHNKANLMLAFLVRLKSKGIENLAGQTSWPGEFFAFD